MFVSGTGKFTLAKFRVKKFTPGKPEFTPGKPEFTPGKPVRLNITCCNKAACFNVLSGVRSFASAYAVRLL